MLNLNLQSEYIFSILGLNISNTFFTSSIITILIILISFVGYLFRNSKQLLYLKKVISLLVYSLLKLIDSTIENKKISYKVLPLISTLFIFIIITNLIALIPGFLGSFYIETSSGNIALLRSPNSNLTTTLALAIISVVSIQIFSIKHLGFKKYIQRFINISSFNNFLMGIFELLSESIRIFSFSFRLFGNIFAGEVLLLIVSFLIPYIAPLPFMTLEIFVGSIQAFIFAILTVTFMKSSALHNLKV